MVHRFPHDPPGGRLPGLRDPALPATRPGGFSLEPWPPHGRFVRAWRSSSSTACRADKGKTSSRRPPPMMWVARAGRAAGRSLRPARRIWIGRTDPCAIGLAARRRRLRFVPLALLRAIRGADPRAGRGIRFHDTVVRATGRDQTAVELPRGAIDQPGPEALPHGAHEQLRKHRAAPPRPRLREHAVIGRLVIEAGAQEPPPIQPLGAGAAPARVRRGRSPGKAETGVSTAPPGSTEPLPLSPSLGATAARTNAKSSLACTRRRRWSARPRRSSAAP